MRSNVSAAIAWVAALLLYQGAAAPAAENRVAPGTFELTAVSPPSMAAQSPDLAIGPDGSINIVWLGENTAPPNAAQIAARGHSHDSSTNLYFARSTDGGRSFSSPQQVNPGKSDVWGFSISKPRIAISEGGVIHILYPGNARNATTGENETVALYARATSDRLVFETPRRLNVDALTDALTKDDGGSFATIVTGPQQQVYAAWIDTRTMTSGETARAALTISHDDGKTFSRDFEILPSMENIAITKSSYSPTRAAASTLVVAWPVRAGNWRVVHESLRRSPYEITSGRPRFTPARSALMACTRPGPTMAAIPGLCRAPCTPRRRDPMRPRWSSEVVDFSWCGRHDSIPATIACSPVSPTTVDRIFPNLRSCRFLGASHGCLRSQPTPMGRSKSHGSRIAPS